jgi:hypothetical protein
VDLEKAGQGARIAARRCLCFFKLGDQGARALHKHPPRFGQCHGPGGAFEQLRAQMIFQRADQP